MPKTNLGGYSKIVAQGVVSYGVTAVPLQVNGVPCDLILVVPDAGNTGASFYGGSGVTVANGMPLVAYPESEAIPLTSTGLVYLISDTAGQSARFIAYRV